MGIVFNTPYIKQLNTDVTNKRLSRWEICCVECQSKRIVTYSQAWNIAKANNSGRCQSCAEKNKYKDFEKGREIKRKLSASTTKRNTENSPSKCPIAREKISKSRKGKYGPLSNNWKGGTKKARNIEMSRIEYRTWRKSVLQRDNYTCTQCESKEKLQVDHIIPWSVSIEHRYNLSNGRVLCFDCHKKTDTYGIKARKFKKGKNGISL